MEIQSVMAEEKRDDEMRIAMEKSSMLVLGGVLFVFLALFVCFLVYYFCIRRSRGTWTWFRSRTTLSPATVARTHAAEKVMTRRMLLVGDDSRLRSELDDLETPLYSEDLDQDGGQTNILQRKCTSEDPDFQNIRSMDLPRQIGFSNKQKLVPKYLRVNQGESILLDVDSEVLGDLRVGQTLKQTAILDQPEGVKRVRKEEDFDLANSTAIGRQRISSMENKSYQRSCLSLEVIFGPSKGICYSLVSTDTSRPQMTLGRVPPSDLLLKDSEVSGKHALISWNRNNLRWELVDMGSLNGTFLNSQPIHLSDSGYRHWSNPVELGDGDTVTLGTSSILSVHIKLLVPIPFGIGIASDPMALRRGGKKFPMEDMHYCQWPLPGVEQFGLFGIFDGHGGAGAAKEASKTLPLKVGDILSDPKIKERVITSCDASEVLKDAFMQAEAAMNHQYEGCTATVLLVWVDHSNKFFAQCANVGDSACVANINGTTINMTEDHKFTSPSERTRLSEAGMPLNDGETRLCGVNLARMLGDKFLKEQDSRFSSVPFISQVVHITRTKPDFIVLASDGLWDVISIKRTVQLILRMDRGGVQNSADVVANFLLNEARNFRTRDNTSIVFLDFDTMPTDH